MSEQDDWPTLVSRIYSVGVEACMPHDLARDVIDKLNTHVLRDDAHEPFYTSLVAYFAYKLLDDLSSCKQTMYISFLPQSNTMSPFDCNMIID